MKIKLLLCTLFLSCLCSACANYDFSRSIHEQGNLLPQSEITQLKTGMHKDTVAKILGTSLLSPTFTNNRWDYAYTWRKGNGPIVIRNISLYFHNDTLVRIEHKP